MLRFKQQERRYRGLLDVSDPRKRQRLSLVTRKADGNRKYHTKFIVTGMATRNCERGVGFPSHMSLDMLRL